MEANKRWVRMGRIDNAPDGTFYIHRIKYTTNPENGDVWAFIKHPGKTEPIAKLHPLTERMNEPSKPKRWNQYKTL